MDDWATRSTANGVIFANRLDTQSAIDTYKVDISPPHVSFDSSIKPDGAGGSLKIDVLSGDDTSATGAMLPFGQNFAEGKVFWVQFRLRVPPHHAYQPWPGGTGSKQAIIRWDSPSRAIHLTSHGGLLLRYRNTT